MTSHYLDQLEQLERLRSEVLTSDPKSKQDKVKIFKKLPKIQILKFGKKLYMQHTVCSCFIRCINMTWIQPEL